MRNVTSRPAVRQRLVTRWEKVTPCTRCSVIDAICSARRRDAGEPGPGEPLVNEPSSCRTMELIARGRSPGFGGSSEEDLS